MKKVALHNLGCKVNAYETEAMQEILEQNGYEIVPFEEKADAYIVNTCSVTNMADKKSRQMLHRAKKMNPEAVVIAAGCYVQSAGEELLKDTSVDILIGNNEKVNLPSILENWEKEHNPLHVHDLTREHTYEELTLSHTAGHTRAFMKIQDGCNQFSSYCQIPYVRGRVRSRQPELRDEKRIRYKEEYDIPDYDIDILTNSKKLADIFEEAIALGAAPKKVSNWLMVETMRLMKEASIDADDLKFSAKNLAAIIKMVDDKVINGTVAKEVFEKVFAEDIDPETYVEEHGLKTVNDEGALRTVILDVIEKNPKSVADFKGGKEKAIGALVGQTMKAMQGKADPSEVNRILREELSK